MAKIIIGTAEGKKIGFDLGVLIPSRMLIQANSGAGKSYLLRKLMEELFGHVQVIAIDPEGEFATLREKFDYVLVGKGGETPVHISTAAEVALKLLELRASAVCDLYETPARERHAWVATFLDALMNAPKKLWHPLIVVVDEAHLFCPEEGKSEASDAMIDLATRGRKRGFCAVWATQRLAKLNKDAAAELQNKLIGGTFLDVDINRAAKDLGIPSGKEYREFAAHIQVVEPGTFIALGRAISKKRIELQVGEVRTSHPQSGSAKHAAGPPPAPAKVKALLPQLADLPKVAEEKARTVKEFQARIRELSNELAQVKRAVPKTSAPVDSTELKKLRLQFTGSARRARDLKAALEALTKMATNIVSNGLQPVVLSPDDFKPAVERVISEVVKIAQKKFDQRNGDFQALTAELRKALPRLTKLLSQPDEEVPTPGVETSVPRVPPKVRENRNGNTGENLQVDGLNRRQLDILAALAKFEAIGRRAVDKRWVAALAQVSHTSGQFGNNLGGMRTAGYIEYPQSGVVALTDAGRNVAPAVDPPSSPEEMLAQCKEIVSPAQGLILDALAESYPEPLEKAAIAEDIGVSPTSGNFANNLGALRSAGMILYPSTGTAKLEKWVMLEE